MFSSIEVRNVQEAYVRGLNEIRVTGELQETRNGSALVIPWPVVTVYERPYERVLLDPVRDCNPFFHLMEAMWMLAGRNDVESLLPFNASFPKFSDNGETYHGAYGHRWRRHFSEDYWQGSNKIENGRSIDQLAKIIQLLRDNPGDRRIVLQMWDPETDLAKDGKDFPCNTQVMFRVRRRPAGGWNMGINDLDMTIVNRSNDAIWGAYGSNAVHFSILQEFVAAAIGASPGRMYQWSNNLHAYTEILDRVGTPRLYTTRDLTPEPPAAGPSVGLTMYSDRNFHAEPLFRPSRNMPLDTIFEEIEEFWNDTLVHAPRFFTTRGLRTLECVRRAYLARNSKEYDVAQTIAGDIPHTDWRRACVEWLERRAAKRQNQD